MLELYLIFSFLFTIQIPTVIFWCLFSMCYFEFFLFFLYVREKSLIIILVYHFYFISLLFKILLLFTCYIDHFCFVTLVYSPRDVFYFLFSILSLFYFSVLFFKKYEKQKGNLFMLFYFVDSVNLFLLFIRQTFFFSSDHFSFRFYILNLFFFSL